MPTIIIDPILSKRILSKLKTAKHYKKIYKAFPGSTERKLDAHLEQLTEQGKISLTSNGEYVKL